MLASRVKHFFLLNSWHTLIWDHIHRGYVVHLNLLKEDVFMWDKAVVMADTYFYPDTAACYKQRVKV